MPYNEWIRYDNFSAMMERDIEKDEYGFNLVTNKGSAITYATITFYYKNEILGSREEPNSLIFFYKRDKGIIGTATMDEKYNEFKFDSYNRVVYISYANCTDEVKAKLEDDNYFYVEA